MRRFPIFGLAAVLALSAITFQARSAEIINASYDVSRELFEEINPVFIAEWKAKSGEALVIRQSHAGSSRQARAVVDGLQADVVTFNQVTDIELLRKNGLVGDNWQQRLPNSSSPFYSVPIFLVRQGNPKKIRDWNDLTRADVKVIVPNPKTSGNGRYSYLAAYAYALETFKQDPVKAKDFVGKILANVPVFDTGGRGATTTFVERQLGDVLITFEAEVNAIRKEYDKTPLDAVVPSISVRADFPVAVVDKVVDRRKTRKVAEAYLAFLYSERGQDLIAKRFNRVQNAKIAEQYKAQFPLIKLATIDSTFGGWDTVSKVHFADGGILDQALAQSVIETK